MLSYPELQKCLFLDIETVSDKETCAELPPRMQDLWSYKSTVLQNQPGREVIPADRHYEEKAAIYAEFGRIICISCGFLFEKGGQWGFRIKSFYGHDEVTLLKAFSEMLARSAQFSRLCAHNGKEFDFPYICRRLMIRGLSLPVQLDTQGKKPWETGHLDTMELWKFGDYKSFTSLDLLSAVLDIPSPKDDISGADVGRVYWKENGLDRIRTYCEKDVLTTCQVLLKLNHHPLIAPEMVEIA